MLLRLSELKSSTSNIVSKARSIERIVLSQRFEEAWNNSNDDAKLKVQNIIHWLNRGQLESWLNKYEKRKALAELSTAELKALARQQGIPYYSRLMKSQLLDALEDEYEETRNAGSDADNAEPDGTND